MILSDEILIKLKNKKLINFHNYENYIQYFLNAYSNNDKIVTKINSFLLDNENLQEWRFNQLLSELLIFDVLEKNQYSFEIDYEIEKRNKKCEKGRNIDFAIKINESKVLLEITTPKNNQEWAFGSKVGNKEESIIKEKLIEDIRNGKKYILDTGECKKQGEGFIIVKNIKTKIQQFGLNDFDKYLIINLSDFNLGGNFKNFYDEYLSYDVEIFNFYSGIIFFEVYEKSILTYAKRFKKIISKKTKDLIKILNNGLKNIKF